jgi:hypothetical protein
VSGVHEQTKQNRTTIQQMVESVRGEFVSIDQRISKGTEDKINHRLGEVSNIIKHEIDKELHNPAPQIKPHAQGEVFNSSDITRRYIVTEIVNQ